MTYSTRLRYHDLKFHFLEVYNECVNEIIVKRYGHNNITTEDVHELSQSSVTLIINFLKININRQVVLQMTIYYSEFSKQNKTRIEEYSKATGKTEQNDKCGCLMKHYPFDKAKKEMSNSHEKQRIY